VEALNVRWEKMSKKRPVNVEVSLKNVGGDFNKLIRRFMKKVKKERIIEDYLDRRFYEKPSDKRRKSKLKKLRNAQKAERERNKKLDIR
jgi:ribosomal protein S21